MMTSEPTSLLVVDPNAESLFALAAQLTARDFHVHSATSIEQAFAIAIRESLDVLVSASRLDVGNGDLLAESLKSIQRHRELPAIFFSSTQRADVILGSRGSRSCYRLKSPLDPDVLVSFIEITLSMADKLRGSRPGIVQPDDRIPVIPAPHLSGPRPMDTVSQSSQQADLA